MRRPPLPVRYAYPRRSRVAQSAERPAVNRQVIGSSPIAGAHFMPLTWGFCAWRSVPGLRGPADLVLACVDHDSESLRGGRDSAELGAGSRSVCPSARSLSGADPWAWVRLVMRSTGGGPGPCLGFARVMSCRLRPVAHAGVLCLILGLIPGPVGAIQPEWCQATAACSVLSKSARACWLAWHLAGMLPWMSSQNLIGRPTRA
jgi:hypothetical protein